MPKFTISVSQGNTAERHSRREYTPDSADRSLQGDNVTIYDCGNDRANFNEFFRDSIESYNAKQKRADRKKSLDYVSALEDGIEGYGRGKAKEKPFYHDVIQIGNRKTNGVTKSTFKVDTWRKLKAQGKFDEASKYVALHYNRSKDREAIREILQEVAEEIRDNKDGKYSNILIHGLVIHGDEPNGTDHLDMRYTIFTEGEKTGLSKRVSMTKGLAKMGYDTDAVSTALEKFREDIKTRIEEKMLERGLQREVLGEHRKHTPTAVYELEQRAKEAEERLADAESDFNARESALNVKAEKLQALQENVSKSLAEASTLNARTVNLFENAPINNLVVAELRRRRTKDGKNAYDYYRGEAEAHKEEVLQQVKQKEAENKRIQAEIDKAMGLASDVKKPSGHGGDTFNY